MAFKLFCMLFGMHDFKVVNQNTDQPMHRCLRCGKEQPYESPIDKAKRLGSLGGFG
jgi:hypothetical protein